MTGMKACWRQGRIPFLAFCELRIQKITIQTDIVKSKEKNGTLLRKIPWHGKLTNVLNEAAVRHNITSIGHELKLIR